LSPFLSLQIVNQAGRKPPMFKSLLLGNFKAFGATQRVPIRPLTVIFGPNSAGKSSLIHALLMANEAHTSDEPRNLDVTRPRLSGDSVDLGGFRQFVHKKNVGSTVEWGAEFDTATLTGRLAELFASVRTVTVAVTIGMPHQEFGVVEIDQDSGKEVGKPFTKKLVNVYGPEVESYQLLTDGRVLLRASRKRLGDDWRMGVDEIDGENPVLLSIVRAIVESATTTETLHNEDFQTVQQTIDALVPELSLDLGRFLPNAVKRASTDGSDGQQRSLFAIGRADRQGDLRKALEFLLPRSLDEIVGGLESSVGNTLLRLRYLGPLRSYPPRHLAFAQYHDPNWYAGGGYAWDRVRTDNKVRDAVNDWLSSPKRMKTPYQLIVRNLYAEDDLEQPFWSTLEGMSEEGLEVAVDYDRSGTPESGYPAIKDYDVELERFQANLKTSGIESIRDLMLVDLNRKTVVSHRDVGIGVSQVLPVLVAAFAADSEVVAIEQPELHLHPALQAELGDVFITAALGERKNTFLLETHSEHLILRLLKRIRETSAGKNKATAPVTPDDVMLLYVQPADGESRFIELRADKHGRLIDTCPDGFFEEDFAELF
jgi:hypothetical protein